MVDPQVTVGFNTVHHDGQKAAAGCFRQSLAAMPLGDRAALDLRQDIIVVSVVVDDVDRVQRQRYHPSGAISVKSRQLVMENPREIVENPREVGNVTSEKPGTFPLNSVTTLRGSYGKW